jgi:hypothetical protein
MLNAWSNTFVSGASKSVAQSGGELTHIKRRNNEVIEEVFTKCEIIELVVIKEQDDWSNTSFTCAKLATKAHGITEWKS